MTGALAATACVLLGNFLVLRQMSMMGDAIRHVVMAGLIFVVVMLFAPKYGVLPKRFCKTEAAARSPYVWTNP